LRRPTIVGGSEIFRTTDARRPTVTDGHRRRRSVVEGVYSATQLNSTQLDVELSWVALLRYKRGFSLFPCALLQCLVCIILIKVQLHLCEINYLYINFMPTYTKRDIQPVYVTDCYKIISKLKNKWGRSEYSNLQLLDFRQSEVLHHLSTQ